MILWLCLPGLSLDSEPGQVLAQPRERPVKQKPSEVVGLVGHQLPAPEADEEVKILPLNIPGAGTSGSLGNGRMGEPQRARVAAKSGEALEQALIRRAREKRGEECV